MHLTTERKLLQATVALACMVPLYAGFSGVIDGAMFMGGGTIDMDSHFRYLSGLLLGIGLSFLSTIPTIERHVMRFRFLTLIVVIGGIGRLLGFLQTGVPGAAMCAALCMELIITPLICLWQHRMAARF